MGYLGYIFERTLAYLITIDGMLVVAYNLIGIATILSL